MAHSYVSSVFHTSPPTFLIGIDKEEEVEYIVYTGEPPMLIKIYDGPEEIEDEGDEDQDLVLATGDFDDDDDDDEDDGVPGADVFHLELFWITQSGPKNVGIEKGTKVVQEIVKSAMDFYIEMQKEME